MVIKVKYYPLGKWNLDPPDWDRNLIRLDPRADRVNLKHLC